MRLYLYPTFVLGCAPRQKSHELVDPVVCRSTCSLRECACSTNRPGRYLQRDSCAAFGTHGRAAVRRRADDAAIHAARNAVRFRNGVEGLPRGASHFRAAVYHQRGILVSAACSCLPPSDIRQVAPASYSCVGALSLQFFVFGAQLVLVRLCFAGNPLPFRTTPQVDWVQTLLRRTGSQSFQKAGYPCLQVLAGDLIVHEVRRLGAAAAPRRQAGAPRGRQAKPLLLREAVSLLWMLVVASHEVELRNAPTRRAFPRRFPVPWVPPCEYSTMCIFVL